MPSLQFWVVFKVAQLGSRVIGAVSPVRRVRAASVVLATMNRRWDALLLKGLLLVCQSLAYAARFPPMTRRHQPRFEAQLHYQIDKFYLPVFV